VAVTPEDYRIGSFLVACLLVSTQLLISLLAIPLFSPLVGLFLLWGWAVAVLWVAWSTLQADINEAAWIRQLTVDAYIRDLQEVSP
jgi:predicted membrane protein